MQGDSTCPITDSRDFEMFWSHSAKKNVLLRMIGPPTLSVYWFWLVHGCVGGPPSTRLSLKVRASRAEFRMFHTAEPWYSLPPDRVVIWICPFPRPVSASTGARTIFISPTMSWFMYVAELIPAASHRWSLTAMPSRITLMLFAVTPAKSPWIPSTKPSVCRVTPAITLIRSRTLLVTVGRLTISWLSSTSPTEGLDSSINWSAEIVTSIAVAPPEGSRVKSRRLVAFPRRITSVIVWI
jgi:hypothetical protein